MKSINRVGEITYVIGKKDYWGKGIGNLAINKIIKIAKKKYNLNKLIAGTANKNIGSIKILKKNKFVLEGVRKKHLFLAFTMAPPFKEAASHLNFLNG